jgi:hypothetical protein
VPLPGWKRAHVCRGTSHTCASCHRITKYRLEVVSFKRNGPGFYRVLGLADACSQRSDQVKVQVGSHRAVATDRKGPTGLDAPDLCSESIALPSADNPDDCNKLKWRC